MSDQEKESEPVADEVAREAAESNPAVGVQDEQAALQVEISALKAGTSALMTEREDLKDQLLRKAADFDNYRKRMLKEKDEARQFANAMLLEDLCQVLDDFERAIRSSEASKDFSSFYSGIIMIEGQFASMLERKYNLKRLESVGQAFNPDLHEAIAMDPAQEGKEIMVVEEYQKGYQLHDRVIRTAKVKVGHPKNIETKEGE